MRGSQLAYLAVVAVALLVCILGSMSGAQRAVAAGPTSTPGTNCDFTAVPSIAFGSYDVYGVAVPSTATINGSCSLGNSSLRPVITLGKGGSTTYHPRKMSCTSGACSTNGYSTDKLAYNLYTTAGLAAIWGDPAVDATTSSVTLPSGCCTANTPWTATVYGTIPAAVSGGANDVSVGGYSDTVVVTMTF